MKKIIRTSMAVLMAAYFLPSVSAFADECAATKEMNLLRENIEAFTAMGYNVDDVYNLLYTSDSIKCKDYVFHVNCTAIMSGGNPAATLVVEYNPAKLNYFQVIPYGTITSVQSYTTVNNLPALRYEENVTNTGKVYTCKFTKVNANHMTNTCITDRLLTPSYITVNMTPFIAVGDANGDGYVDASDADLINEFIAEGGSVIDITAADANLDGSVTTADSTLIYQYCVGLIPHVWG